MAIQSEIILSANITKAERQIKKLEDRIKKLDTKPINVKLKIDTTDIKRAERELQRLARARRSALQVDESVNRTGGGGGGGAAAGLLPGLAAGASASQGITKATKELDNALTKVLSKNEQITAESRKNASALNATTGALQKVTDEQEEYVRLQRQIARGDERIEAAIEKQAAYQRRVNILNGVRRRLTADEAVEREKIFIDSKALGQELKKNVREQVRLADEAERYARSVRGLPKTPLRAPSVPTRTPGGAGAGATVAAASGISSLNSGVLRLAASYIGLNEAIQETRRILDATFTRGQTEIRLKALSEGFDSYEDILSQTNLAAEKFNVSQSKANESFAQLYGRLRPLGLTLQEVNTVYEGFNTAAIISGTTASEARGALLQLAQALGSGVLRGQEFNSVAEQTPAIVRAIGEEMNVPIGQLKEFAKEGKITSDIIVRALERIQRDGADRLATALDSPQQKLIKLNNRLEDLRVALGELVQPAVVTFIDAVTIAVEKATKKVEFYANALDELLKPIGGLNIALPQLADAFAKLPAEIAKSLPGLGQIIRALETVDALAQRFTGGQSGLSNLGPDYKQQEAALFKAAGGYDPYAPTESLADRLGITGGGGGGGGGSSAEDTLKRQLETGQDLSREFSRQLRLLQATEGLERELLQIEFDREDRMRNIADAAADQRAELEALSNAIARSQQQDAAQDSFSQFFQREQERMDAMKQAQSEFNDFFKENQVDLFGDAFRDSAAAAAQALEQTIGVAIQGLINGSEDLGESLQKIGSQLLGQIGSILFRAGMGGLGVPGFATGGFVGPNRTALVGEQGPELIQAGPTGATVTSNPQSEAALSKYGPGNQGMAASAPGSYTINYNGPTLTFNGDDYIPRSEAGQLIAAGAKQGEARTLNSLRNQRSTRSRIGI